MSTGKLNKFIVSNDNTDDGDIDEKLNSANLRVLVTQMLEEKGVCNDLLDSYNDFIQNGITQIPVTMYRINERIPNKRTSTPEDQKITEIGINISFTNVNVGRPLINTQSIGATMDMTPQFARVNGQTYSLPISNSISVQLEAFGSDGTTKVRSFNAKDIPIGTIPCMVRSKYCTTYGLEGNALRDYGEDPTDKGGYFIIKGNDWAMLPTEGSVFNALHVYNDINAAEAARGNIISKAGDAYEKSSQLTITSYIDGSIYLRVTLNRDKKIDFPFYLLFRACGITSDKDIINMIVYGVDNNDRVSTFIKNRLMTAFSTVKPPYIDISKSRVSVDIIKFMGERILAIMNAGNVTDTLTRYYINRFNYIIDHEILPHIGQTTEHRGNKMKYLGHLINLVIRTEMPDGLPPTDRDTYKIKRLDLPGTAMSKLFKTLYNHAVVQQLKRAVKVATEKTSFSSIDLATVIKSAIKSDLLGDMFAKVLTTGTEDLVIQKGTTIKNRVCSEQVKMLNKENVYQLFNSVTVPQAPKSNSAARSIDMRRCHMSTAGYFCFSHTTENASVGMKKQFTCMARVAKHSLSRVIINLLGQDSDIIPLDSLIISDIGKYKLAKVIVNGNWIGCCKNAHATRIKYVNIRRKSDSDIHPHVSIYNDTMRNELYFWSDYGRVTKPFVIVYNNQDKYDQACKDGNPIQFKQWIRLTYKHIEDLACKRIDFEYLRKNGIIEYISIDESFNIITAASINELRADSNNVLCPYTHMEIEQAILGKLVARFPLANHTENSRVSLAVCQTKQGGSWYSGNHHYRIDKNVCMQWMCDRQLAASYIDPQSVPIGAVCQVAFLIKTGYNTEDSLIINKRSAESGMFAQTVYTCEKIKLEMSERFGNPDPDATRDRKQADYSMLEQNGFIKVGSIVTKDTVLVCKVQILANQANSGNRYKFADKSVIYYRDESARVIAVWTGTNAKNETIVIVKLASFDRTIRVGDKCASITGNKGIIASLAPHTDMPYTEDGVVADLIVNPHSIPTRMALNQLMQMLAGLLGACTGRIIDVTAFVPTSIEDMLAKLTESGIPNAGWQTMYDGVTGEPMSSLVFLAPCQYQRLQKYGIDEQGANYLTKLNQLTRQPLSGIRHEGTVKIGEMEKDSMTAQGICRTIHTKMFEDSDAFNMYYCRCGIEAIVNHELGLYKCSRCGENADIVKVDSAWSANLFMKQVNFMGVDTEFKLAPFTYPVADPR